MGDKELGLRISVRRQYIKFNGYCVEIHPQAVALSLRRLAYDPCGWLAGLSRGLGLLMA